MQIASESSVRRLGIFFFYDAQGVVDDYVLTLLDGFQPHVEEFTIVVNGKLNAVGRERLERYTNNLIVRDNKCFDVWAYKAGIEYYGWEKLAQFDEIIFEDLVEKAVVESSSCIRFKLINGVEISESLERPVR